MGREERSGEGERDDDKLNQALPALHNNRMRPFSESPEKFGAGAEDNRTGRADSRTNPACYDF